MPARRIHLDRSDAASGSGARPVEVKECVARVSQWLVIVELRQDQRLVSLLVSLLRLGYLHVVYSASQHAPA